MSCCFQCFFIFSSEILEYLSREINPLLQNQTKIYNNNQHRYLTVKIKYFSSDSLSAAHLLGFKKSFNHRYCCRFCLTPKENFTKIFFEKNVALRDKCFYEEAYRKCVDLDSNQDFFGITQQSVLRFFYFDLSVDLFPPCIDHDIFKGILPKIVIFSLNYFVKKKFFSFSFFKNQLLEFKFSGKDKLNFPLIETEILSKIRFIAEEGYTFIRFYLNFLQLVPTNDEVFILLTIFAKTVLILMSFEFSNEKIIMLDNLIEDFLKKCSLYPDQLKMTIKFHHLVHYPRYIQNYGCPRFFSTRNFESMHSFLKSKFKNSKNWKSVPYTIASKYSRSNIAKPSEHINELGVRDFNTNIINLNCSNNVKSIKTLKYFNIIYKENKNVVFFKQTELKSLYLHIKYILKIDNEYLFYGDLYESFYDEYKSIIILEETNEYSTIYLNNLSDLHSYELYKSQSYLYIVPYFF